nr:hypothetical protein Iba_chr13fCG2430 [Ipomoea batatas]
MSVSLLDSRVCEVKFEMQFSQGTRRIGYIILSHFRFLGTLVSQILHKSKAFAKVWKRRRSRFAACESKFIESNRKHNNAYDSTLSLVQNSWKRMIPAESSHEVKDWKLKTLRQTLNELMREKAHTH